MEQYERSLLELGKQQDVCEEFSINFLDFFLFWDFRNVY
jgi:hypothetical protein